jgi:hypothetical protein
MEPFLCLCANVYKKIATVDDVCENLSSTSQKLASFIICFRVVGRAKENKLTDEEAQERVEYIMPTPKPKLFYDGMNVCIWILTRKSMRC